MSWKDSHSPNPVFISSSCTARILLSPISAFRWKSGTAVRREPPMAMPDDSDPTSGDGAILIEIICQSAPIPPEARERARRRARQQRQLGHEPVPPSRPARTDDPPPDQPM